MTSPAYPAAAWRNVLTRLIAAAVVVAPSGASAHTLVVPYTLPVPFWMYRFACGATLVLTFAALGLGATVTVPAGIRSPVTQETPSAGWLIPRPLVELLRVATIFILLMTVTAGLIGPRDP